MTKTCHQLLTRAATCLRGAGISNAEQEAWWLLEFVTGQSKAALLAHTDQAWPEQDVQQLEQLLVLRAEQAVPLQYLLGSVPFAGLDIMVRPPTLIPRPATEEMVLWVIEQFKPLRDVPLTVLDLCTGSGCIALALAAAFPAWQVIGSDISHDAIALAQENKLAAGLTNVTFIQGDLFAPLGSETLVDMIISNPPYISQESYDQLSPSVRNFEDKHALWAPADGMKFYQDIFMQARSVLKKNEMVFQHGLPNVICEIGIDQQGIQELVDGCGAQLIKLHRDISGIQRWLAALI